MWVVCDRSLPGDPTGGNRTATFVVSDRLGGNSLPASATIEVRPINDAPILDLGGGDDVGQQDYLVTFTEEGPQVALTSNTLTLVDLDNETLVSATVVVSPIPDGSEEMLGITFTSLLTSYNVSTGTLLIEGPATVAAFEAALRNTFYRNVADEPTNVTRTVTFTVSDGLTTSTPQRTVITIAFVNDAPAVERLGDRSVTISLVEDTVATLFDNITVTDDDDTTLLLANVTVLNPADEDTDRLYLDLAASGVAAVSGLVMSGNNTTTVVLTGPAAISDVVAAIRAMTFGIESQDPSPHTREIELVVTDPSGAESNTFTTRVLVIRQNDAPFRTAAYPYDAPVVMDEDTNVTLEILRYFDDSDNELTPASVRIIGFPSHGVATLLENGDIEYVPSAHYFGADAVELSVCDTVICAFATITLDVVAVNDVPIAEHFHVSVAEDFNLTVNLTAHVRDRANELEDLARYIRLLTYPTLGRIMGLVNLSSLPSESADTTTAIPSDDSGSGSGDDSGDSSGGDVSGDDGSGEDDMDSAFVFTGAVVPLGVFVYVPFGNAFGVDRVVYEVCDDEGSCSNATITISVLSRNDVPTSVNVTIEVLEDGVATVNLSQLVFDVEDVPVHMEYAIIDGTPYHGSANISNTTILTYAPFAHYFGSDVVRFRACDVNGSCTDATVYFTVVSVNDAPEVRPLSVIVLEDQRPGAIIGLHTVTYDVEDLLDNGTSLLQYTVTPAAHGVLTRIDASTFEYVGNHDYFGPDTFTYEVCDVNASCASETVSVTVLPVNDAPTADSAEVTVPEDTQVVTNLLALVDDVETPLTMRNIFIAIPPAHGEVTLDASGNATYTPNRDYNGHDEYRYRVCDAGGKCATSFVHVLLTPVNDGPSLVSRVEPGTTEGMHMGIVYMLQANRDVQSMLSARRDGSLYHVNSVCRHQFCLVQPCRDGNLVSCLCFSAHTACCRCSRGAFCWGIS